MNLYSNAIKFTPRHGRVIIIIEKVASNVGDQIIVTVMDSGLGIKNKHKNKLFKMFSSIKDEKKKINL